MYVHICSNVYKICVYTYCVCVYSVMAIFLRPPVTLQAPLSLGFPRQEYWSGLPFSSSRGSSQPSDQTLISCISCIGRWILLPLHHLGSPCIYYIYIKSYMYILHIYKVQEIDTKLFIVISSRKGSRIRSCG